MVFELSGDYLIVLPLILSTVVATAASTLCGWVADVATALPRLASSSGARCWRPTTCRRTTRRSPVLDDPTASYKGRLWTYLDPLGRQVVFETRGPRRDDLATVKLRAITEVRRDST
jgi:hypothetical protein